MCGNCIEFFFFFLRLIFQTKPYVFSHMFQSLFCICPFIFCDHYHIIHCSDSLHQAYSFSKRKQLSPENSFWILRYWTLRLCWALAILLLLIPQVIDNEQVNSFMIWWNISEVGIKRVYGSLLLSRLWTHGKCQLKFCFEVFGANFSFLISVDFEYLQN